MGFDSAGVVVTCNRKELLLHNLSQLLSQSMELNKIYIIDNASTDGTYEYLREKDMLKHRIIEYVRLDENSGGAGGFYEGVKRSFEAGYDYVWLMDDDGAPYNKDTFQIIMEKAKEFKQKGKELFVLNSLVVCEEDALSFGLGEGIINTRKEAIDKAKDGVIYSTLNPFNGTLITRELIAAAGYPNKEFFIKGDDADYMLRCKAAKATLATVVDSIYFHPALPTVKRRFLGKERFIVDEAPWKEYYRTRNFTRIFMERKKYKALYKFMMKRLMTVFVSKEYKFKKLRMVLKGFLDGLTGKMGKRVLP
jgi:rhamnopyranosyl-N-acetylglucosaminyl-diphospho-decaprenol beta-1,3/1,4-galactofuranosyltransferase